MNAPTATPFPLETMAAEFADHGGKIIPQTGDLALHRYASGMPANILSQPPGEPDELPVALGLRAVRQVYERRVAHKKTADDKRTSDFRKAELLAEVEKVPLHELLGADNEVRVLESNLAATEAKHYGLPALEPHDAATATGDAERRAFLRGLKREERVQAMRADPRLLLAAARDPLLSGITSEHDRSQLDRDWRAACDARDPAQAERLDAFRAKVEWSRRAINAAVRQLAAELSTDAPTLVANLDSVDTLRLAKLATIRLGEKRLTPIVDTRPPDSITDSPR